MEALFKRVRPCSLPPPRRPTRPNFHHPCRYFRSTRPLALARRARRTPRALQYDTDNSGFIDAKELEKLLKDLDFNVRNEGTVRSVFCLSQRAPETNFALVVVVVGGSPSIPGWPGRRASSPSLATRLPLSLPLPAMAHSTARSTPPSSHPSTRPPPPPGARAFHGLLSDSIDDRVRQQTQLIYRRLDTSNDGRVDVGEFSGWCVTAPTTLLVVRSLAPASVHHDRTLERFLSPSLSLTHPLLSLGSLRPVFQVG